MKRLIVPLLTAALVAACGVDGSATGARPLEALCVPDAASVPAGGWVCGEDRVLECTSPQGTSGPTLYVVDAACGQVTVSDPGPFGLGTRSIDIVDHGALVIPAPPPRALCSATLTVVDTTPPRITDRATALWPPNHQLHRILPEDCAAVTDVCDPQLEVSFTFVASDEPINAQGDGNSDPDVVLGCDAVELRAERQGGGDGRLYTLGVRARDGAGNVAEGTCTVQVAHDRGAHATAVPSAQAYRVDAPARCAPGPS